VYNNTFRLRYNKYISLRMARYLCVSAAHNNSFFFLSSVRRHAVAIVGYSTVVCDRRCVTLILFDHFSYLMAYIQYIKLCMK